MAKRKLKELEGNGLKDEPRRSSRRISTTKEETTPDTASSSTKTKKTTKKPSKRPDAVVNGEGEGTTEPVGANLIFWANLSMSCLWGLKHHVAFQSHDYLLSSS